MGPKTLRTGIVCAAALFAAACDTCEIGTTWCEDDVVMVCVPTEDASNSADDGSFETADDDDDGSWADLIGAVVDIAEGAGRSEVLESCGEMGLVCVEKTDPYNDELYAACDWDMEW